MELHEDDQGNETNIDIDQQLQPAPGRQRKPPAWLNDYICHSESVQEGKRVRCRYPIHEYITYANISSNYKHFLLSTDVVFEPYSFDDARKEQRWVDAMKEEMKALEENKTWEIVELPKGKVPIGCKWVYKVKYKTDGSTERCKARLVAKGYSQQEGVDYFETFSPVVKMVTVRIILSFAALYDWPLFQMDVHNAFLQGDLHEEVYMKIPQGFEQLGKGKVCKLLKSLYGLKQASRQWNAKLTKALIQGGV